MNEIEIVITLQNGMKETMTVPIPAELPSHQYHLFVMKALMEVSQIGVARVSPDKTECSLIPPHQILKLAAKVPQITLITPAQASKLIL